MNSIRHLIFSVFIILFIITLGITGYMTIEGWDLLDALYMTVITLSTVGYGEVHEVSEAGRVFTIILVFVGVTFFLYVAGAVVQFGVVGGDDPTAAAQCATGVFRAV